MKKITFFIMVMLLATSNTYAKWDLVDSLTGVEGEYAKFYKAIDCYDSQNCVSLLLKGDQTIIARTTSDGGISWLTSLRDTILRNNEDNIIYMPPKPNNIYYHSKNLCIALCDSGYYWRSTDSCHTWKKHKIDTDKSLLKIDFYDDMTGIMSTYYQLYKTIDGGLTWDSVFVNSEVSPTGYHDICMIDDDIQIILGYNIIIGDYIIRSDDGGNSWTNYEVISPRVRGMHFFNKSEGMAYGKQQIKPGSSKYRDIIQETADGGKTWEVRLDSQQYPSTGLLRLDFADRMHGIAIGTYYKLWKTVDGGKTWLLDTTLNYSTVNNYFWDISYPSPDTVYGVTANTGKIYMKTDYTVGVEAEQERTYTSVSLYPNPARSGETITIVIESAKPESCVATVYAVDGRQISDSFQFDLKPGRNGIQYSADRDLSPGVYFVLIEKGCGVISVKFVVGG